MFILIAIFLAMIGMPGIVVLVMLGLAFVAEVWLEPEYDLLGEREGDGV